MVVTDAGMNWVHCWALWSGKSKMGKYVNVPVHISSMAKNGKVIYQGVIVDGLPGYLASQPADSGATNP